MTYYTTLPEIFGVKKYAASLMKVVQSRYENYYHVTINNKRCWLSFLKKYKCDNKTQSDRSWL